jgi:CubicO group peptidase (beta-lactamase class C family)
MIITNRRDYWPTNDWKNLSPESVGIDSNKLFSIDKEIEVRLRGVNCFLIIRNGNIIHEKYFNGYNREYINHMCSVTKTIISALIGIAIEKKFIKSVDQKVLDYFPDFKPKKSDYFKSHLRIKHFLTMTTGLMWMNTGKGHEPMFRRLLKEKNWVNSILNLPTNDRMFGQFQYSSAVSHLLSAIITKATKNSTQGFAERHLFKPIGISNKTEWMKDPQGINIGGYGLKLSPRDLAKFGFLYLNQGIWKDKQIIPKEWIVESLQNYGEGYGYHVWITKIGDFNAFMAAGYGGQYLTCFPKLDLIIVITSNALIRRWRDPRYINDKLINDIF